MAKRTDIKSILIIGAGPIVIGQACEFDYSGAQACKALQEEGYRVILVNSNPATIMTDPGMADATYIEPITWQMLEKIIAREKPDAILPTMGGQTALNCALDLAKHGVLEKYGVEHFDGQGLDVRAIGQLRIGHDRRRVAVDEDHFEAFRAERLAGLAARIVELARLPDDDRTGADDEHALEVCAFWHQLVKGQGSRVKGEGENQRQGA